MSRIPRRDFLKAATVASVMAPLRGRAAPAGGADVRISGQTYSPVSDYPIRPKRHAEVTLTDAFWKPKVDINANVTIPVEIRKLAESPRGLSGNVLEAAILSLESRPNAWLQAQVEAAVGRLKTQERSGNAGFEVAATYYMATGRRDLLDPAIEAAAALYDEFVAKNPPFSGGERDAINCVQLYRVTNEKKHLDLAKHYLDIRGLENSVNRSRHNQSHKPVLEQTEAVGHAVNCASLMVSLADVGVLTGLQDYFAAAERLWRDVVERKLYITGGVGATGNEGFGEAYALPNISAYSETCAVLMFITFNHRMFLATGDSKYIDVLERGMYNNALDGVSVSGDRFFYVNRLASAGDGRDARWERASLECCPPNLVRFLASMPGFVYAQDKSDGIYVNLYVSNETSFKVGGKALALSVTSEMPWGGRSTIAVSTTGGTPATIKLRIPGWARNEPVPGSLYRYLDRDRPWRPASAGPVEVSVNGTRASAVPDRAGYVAVTRTWRTGDRISLQLPVAVRRVAAHDRVHANRRRVAIERGPVVYCAESPDVENGRVLGLQVDANEEFNSSLDSHLYGGVTVIEGRARSVSDPSAPPRRVRLIPYHLWANRGAGEMTVWLLMAGYAAGDVGPAGGFIFYENPTYAADGWRYLEAAPFDQSAGAKWGCFRRAIEGARGTAVGTGQQNTRDMRSACSERGTAADLCATLTVNGVGDWFLPSRDELALMYRNLKATGVGDFPAGGAADNVSYWASSQLTADMAAHIDFADLGRQHFDDKDFPRRVRAIRAF
jgi:uncharacterized protein